MIKSRSQLRVIHDQTLTMDFASINANSVATVAAVPVPGARANDVVLIGPPAIAAVTSGVIFVGHVDAANSVKVYGYNVTAGALDPASATFRVTVLRFQ